MPEREDPAERSQKEKAEGSRENVNVNASVNEGSATTSRMERGSGQVSQPGKPLPETTSKPGGAGGPGGQSGQHPDTKGQTDAGGITNRPLHQEEQEQGGLPPRGTTKDEK